MSINRKQMSKLYIFIQCSALCGESEWTRDAGVVVQLEKHKIDENE